MLTSQLQEMDVDIPSQDGINLKGRLWPCRDARGIVIVSHGFGEHGGCYAHVAEAIGEASRVDFLAPDLRGHGRSPGRRGVVGRYQELVEDICSAIEWAARERPGLPRYLLGHSNGGLLALLLAAEPSLGLSGLITSNPSVKLAAHVPAYKLALGRFLLRHAPGVTLSAKLAAEMMTRDPEMQTQHRVDPLRHSRISAPLFFGMVDSGAMAVERAGRIEIPTLMLVGADDHVSSPKGSALVFERLGTDDKTLRLYPEMRHEPLNEIGREVVFNDLAGWLNVQLDSSSS
ncbi:lysophospholipase [Singulisphaera sp. PoT]|uniref:alpha/beta hydrolase n=1 Tax=Singulisphaera sp. PoT TaxID=3411797 RepID=UPI003BF460A5